MLQWPPVGNQLVVSTQMVVYSIISRKFTVSVVVVPTDWLLSDLSGLNSCFKPSKQGC